MLERRSSARMPSRNFDGRPWASASAAPDTRPAGLSVEREQRPHRVVDLRRDLHGYRAHAVALSAARDFVRCERGRLVN